MKVLSCTKHNNSGSCFCTILFPGASGSGSGWKRTYSLGIMGRVFYHCATKNTLNEYLQNTESITHEES